MSNTKTVSWPWGVFCFQFGLIKNQNPENNIYSYTKQVLSMQLSSYIVSVLKSSARWSWATFTWRCRTRCCRCWQGRQPISESTERDDATRKRICSDVTCADVQTPNVLRHKHTLNSWIKIASWTGTWTPGFDKIWQNDADWLCSEWKKISNKKGAKL